MIDLKCSICLIKFKLDYNELIFLVGWLVCLGLSNGNLFWLKQTKPGYSLTQVRLYYITEYGIKNSTNFINRYQGYKKFLKEITDLEDVWVVPVSAGIEYMKDPKTNQQLIDGELPAFGCKNFPPEDCISPQNCKYVINKYLLY